MRRLAPFSALVLLSCDALPYEIDSFPVPIDTASTVPVLLAAPGDETPVRVVLDTGAPLTVLNAERTTRSRAPLTLFGSTPADPPIPRARFLSAAILRRPVTAIGSESGGVPVVPIDGAIGGDILSPLSTRVDLLGGQVRFFTDVAASDDRFYHEGHAVIHTGPSGGGSFELEGGIVFYPGSRMVVPACLEQQPITTAFRPREDALLVVATGFDRTLLTESAYTRARRTVEPDFQPAFVFDQPYHIPGASQPVMVHYEVLSQVALTDDEHRSRGGCDELLLNRLMQEGGCPANLRCPCPDVNATDCPAGSTVQILEPIEVAVIADDDPLLLPVREELRPRYADIDGFLGAAVLRNTIFDLDYAHSRIIVRCATDACRTDPRVDPR